MSKNKTELISVIVPTYKQEKTIKRDLKNILTAFEGGIVGYDAEVICVVDGMLDDTYKEALKVKDKRLRVYGYKKNMGKGYAVRYGMSKAKGDLISFLDAGMDISPKSMTMLLTHMQWYNADVIVGSKRHPVSQVNYPLLRKILSYGYYFGVKILFGLRLTDTQSGIKLFKRKVIEKIISKLLVKTYAMDIEMLAVAYHFGFTRIFEAPIEVRFNKQTSRIKWRTIFWMIWDTMAVFYRLRILHYYDKVLDKKLMSK